MDTWEYPTALGHAYAGWVTLQVPEGARVFPESVPRGTLGYPDTLRVDIHPSNAGVFARRYPTPTLVGFVP